MTKHEILDELYVIEAELCSKAARSEDDNYYLLHEALDGIAKAKQAIEQLDE